MSYYATFVMYEGHLKLLSHPLIVTPFYSYLKEHGWDAEYAGELHKLTISKDDLVIELQSWHHSGIDVTIKCTNPEYEYMKATSLKYVGIEFDDNSLKTRCESNTSTYSCKISVNG